MERSAAAVAADVAIGAYQRYLSPLKGFHCAHRVHTGRRSCSALARGVVQRLGVLALFAALPRQFERCKTAYDSLRSKWSERSDRKNAKNQTLAGRCDINPCDAVQAACDAGQCGADVGSGACEAVGSCSP